MKKMFVIVMLAGACGVAQGETPYPIKPIRVVVGLGAGGATDLLARLLGQKFSEAFGQPVVIENRVGGGGSLANAKVAASPPDGYTLLMITSSATILPALRKLPYDLERDLAPVSLLASGPWVLAIHPSVPVRDIKELIALARAQPGKLNYGTAGAGTAPHLAGELFNLMAQVKTIHVPYKGGTESMVAVVAGQVEISYASVPAALPLVEAGKLRALAVTSARRASSLPSMPTLSESGLHGYDRYAWYGLSAPAGVPKDIVAALNKVIGKAVNTPAIVESFAKQGLEPQTNTPGQFAALIRSEIAENAKLIKMTGVQVD